MEVTGLGAGIDIDELVTTDAVWKVLLLKIEQPQLFLPVTDVIYRKSDDGLGTYREMTVNANGATKRMLENIYSDYGVLEVVFRVIDSNLEHVNTIRNNPDTGKRMLEFYQRSISTKERISWEVPRELALGGIRKVLVRAAEDK